MFGKNRNITVTVPKNLGKVDIDVHYKIDPSQSKSSESRRNEEILKGVREQKNKPTQIKVPSRWEPTQTTDKNEDLAQKGIQKIREREKEDFIESVYLDDTIRFTDSIRFRIRAMLHTKEFEYVISFPSYSGLVGEFFDKTLTKEAFILVKKRYDECKKNSPEELLEIQSRIILYVRKEGEDSFEKYILTLPENWKNQLRNLPTLLQVRGKVIQETLSKEEEKLLEEIEKGELILRTYYD